MLDGGKAFRRRRHLYHQILALYRLPEPFGLGNGALGVHRQIGRDFEADKAVISLPPVIDRAQHVGGILDVLDRELLEQVGDRAIALFERAADRAVIFVRTADRLFENRRVRGHAFDAVLLDQLFQVAVGDEAAGEEIEPNRLAMGFECFDGIHGALFLFGFDFRKIPGSFLRRGRIVNTRVGRAADGICVFPADNAIHMTSIPILARSPRPVLGPILGTARRRVPIRCNPDPGTVL